MSKLKSIERKAGAGPNSSLKTGGFFYFLSFDLERL